MPHHKTMDTLLAELERDAALARFVSTKPGTRFFRRHIPSGRITTGVISPATIRTKIGPFDESLFASRWTETMLHELIGQWNRQGAGHWQYWSA